MFYTIKIRTLSLKESKLLSLFLRRDVEQIFTKTINRDGGERVEGEEALEASTHEQLVFQILMVLNTKRPQQIPTAEVSDGK